MTCDDKFDVPLPFLDSPSCQRLCIAFLVLIIDRCVYVYFGLSYWATLFLLFAGSASCDSELEERDYTHCFYLSCLNTWSSIYSNA